MTKHVREDVFPLVLKELNTVFKPPILDVGSCILGNKLDKRDFTSGEYLGIDIREGRGVDKVLDITRLRPRGFDYFNTVFATDAFEHIDRPWLAAHVIETSMAKGAQIYFSVPFVWRYHEHPHDYWRMTPDAVKILFGQIKWTKIFYTDYFNKIYPSDQINIHIKKKKAPLGYATISILHMLGTKIT